MDKATQRRVWERVRGGAEPPGPEGLLLEELLDEQAFRRTGQEEQARSCASRAAQLRGICRLAGVAEPRLPRTHSSPVPSPRGQMVRLLVRQRRYEELSGTSEFAVLYRCLAQDAELSCGKYARELGSAPLHPGK